MRYVDKSSHMAATKCRSSIRNYGVKIRLEQGLIQKFQGDVEKKAVKSTIDHQNLPDGHPLKAKKEISLLNENDQDSQYKLYMRGLKNLEKSLQDDEEYTTY